MHTANVVSKVPGNANFDKVVEFSDPYRIFWNRRAYYATQVIFYLCTLCVNVAAIVDTAQVVDSFLGHSSIGTYAISVDQGEGQRWIHKNACSKDEVKLGECLPFEGEDYGQVLFTLGYGITACVFVPICLMDLKVRAIHEKRCLLTPVTNFSNKCYMSNPIGKHCLANFWLFGVASRQHAVRCFVPL